MTTRSTPRRRGAIRPGVVILVVLALGLGVSALRNARSDDRTAALDPSDPGVVHVHGLGLDPADGALFAATHTGLFSLRPGRAAVRVADRYQDTMAFTVTGPGRFIGSGHPDLLEMDRLPEGARPLLGLIESTDAGRSWQALSLTGRADFHALVAAHGLIYGLDSTSGRLLVSAGGRDWETRAALVAGDLAVSPADPGFVVATDGGAPWTSVDGGRSFVRRTGPSLALVEWPAADVLWGLSPGGEVYRSADGGGTWAALGTVAGEPEAFLATADELYASTVDRGILRSGDGGRTWQTFYVNGGLVAVPGRAPTS